MNLFPNHIQQNRHCYDTQISNNILPIDDTKIIILKGYFQSHLYFDQYYDDIIKLMQSQLEHDYEEYKIFKKITMNCINKQIHNNTEGVSL